MKKLLVAACLFALTSTSALAGGVTVDLGAGAALPSSPDFFSDGFDPSVAFNLDLSGQLTGPLGWRVEFGHDRTTSEGEFDIGLTFTRFSGGIQLAPYDSDMNGTPYLFITAGAYISDLSGDDAPDVDSETDFGISFGAGYDYPIGDNWGLGASIRVHGIFSDSDNDDDTLWYYTPAGQIFFSW